METKNVVHVDIEASASVPFFRVETDDGREYQIKIPNVYTTAMLKEYIANQIANKIEKLVPNGAFLRFALPQQQLIPMLEQVAEYAKHGCEPFYATLEELTNTDGEVVLFGVEWMEANKIFFDRDEFDFVLDSCQSDNFYAIFPFDQLLVNKDRHIENLLVCTNENSALDIYLIDHDRIFATAEGIETFDEIRDDFKCLKASSTQYLYEHIKTDRQKDKIMAFANVLQTINKDELIDMLELFRCTCPPDIIRHDDTMQHIASFIAYRATKLCLSCHDNINEGLCYA